MLNLLQFFCMQVLYVLNLNIDGSGLCISVSLQFDTLLVSTFIMSFALWNLVSHYSLHLVSLFSFQNLGLADF